MSILTSNRKNHNILKTPLSMVTKVMRLMSLLHDEWNPKWNDLFTSHALITSDTFPTLWWWGYIVETALSGNLFVWMDWKQLSNWWHGSSLTIKKNKPLFIVLFLAFGGYLKRFLYERYTFTGAFCWEGILYGLKFHLSKELKSSGIFSTWVNLKVSLTAVCQSIYDSFSCSFSYQAC